MTGRIRSIQAAVVVVAAGATVVISVLPELTFAYRSPKAESGLEAAATVVSLIAAYLIYGRLRRTRQLSDLALFIALALLAMLNAIRLATPALTEADSDNLRVWIPLTANLFALGALAVAAFAPETHLPRTTRILGSAVAAVAALGAALVVVGILGPELATGIDPQLSPHDADNPRIAGSPGLIAATLVLACVGVAVAVGFTRRAERTGDELLAWLAIAATLGAFAQLNYLLYPSTYSGWVFTGDLLRFALYAVILVGALRQISVYQERAAAAAALDERRRFARDLHDGLAQDLSFISVHGRALADRDPRAEKIAGAADHALATSRAAILALTGDADEPLPRAIARMATALASRSGVRVELDLDERADTEPRARDELLLALGEAISNATRHGRASRIDVRLSAEPGLRLAISDDGRGFDPSVATNGDEGGFGLTSMRERVEALGGELRVRSGPGEGTLVEMTFQ